MSALPVLLRPSRQAPRSTFPAIRALLASHWSQLERTGAAAYIVHRKALPSTAGNFLQSIEAYLGRRYRATWVERWTQSREANVLLVARRAQGGQG